MVGRQQARRHAIGSGSTPSSPPPPTAAAGTCCVACCSIGASLSMAWHLSPQSPARRRRMFRAEADGLTVHWPGGRTGVPSLYTVLVPKMPLIPFSSKDQNFPGPGLHRPPSYAGVVVLACVLVIGVNAREGPLPSLFFLLLREISSFYYRFRFQIGLNRSELSVLTLQHWLESGDHHHHSGCPLAVYH